MIRMTSWLSMTIVGAFLLSGLGGVALAPALLYSALASALLANFDNIPSYGSRGVHYMRRPLVGPLFFDSNVLDMLFAPRYHPRHTDIYRNVSPSPYPSVRSSIYPTLPSKSYSEFLPASNAGAANPNHVATSFVSKKPKHTSPPPVLPSVPAGMTPSHLAHKPPSSGATHVGGHFVPASPSPSPSPGSSTGPTLYSRRFIPKH